MTAARRPGPRVGPGPPGYRARMASIGHTTRRLREEARTATARGVIKDVLRGYADNELLTYASAIAFQVLFALIPLTLFGLGLAGFFGLQDVYRREAVPSLLDSTSPAMFEVIDSTVRKILDAKQGFWITAGAIIAVWEMSGAMRAIMAVFDRIYGCERERGFRERYVVSIALAVGTGGLLLAAVAVTQLGPLLVGGALAFARWPIAVVLLFASIALLVRYAPAERDPSAHYVTIGSAIVVVAWLLTSIAFTLYVTNVADYGNLFGNLATLIIVFEYLYLAACAFLTGALLDAIMRERVSSE